jgi:ABC-2 type transport system permease protein
MQVFWRELKTNRKSLLAWTIALAALVVLMMSIYPTFRQDTLDLDALLEYYPEAFSKIFGLDELSMAEPIGFYATEAYFMNILFGSLYAAILGASILTKEEDDKTIEFLLARPLSRNRMLANKLLAILVILALFNIGIGLATFVSFAVFDVGDYSSTTLLGLVIAPFFVHLTFAGLAFCLSLFFSRRKTATSMGIGMAIGLYFVNVLATLSDTFSSLQYLTPYYYADAVYIVNNGSLHTVNILILIGVVIIAAAASFFIYNRRDITV